MQSGRGAMLCTACKTGAALHILPGSCTKTTPGFSFTKKQKKTEKEMKKYIEKTDKFRGDFYRYHTGHEWADARNYDLCLNSGKLGFQKCVEEIKAYIKIRFDL